MLLAAGNGVVHQKQTRSSPIREAAYKAHDEQFITIGGNDIFEELSGALKHKILTYTRGVKRKIIVFFYKINNLTIKVS